MCVYWPNQRPKIDKRLQTERAFLDDANRENGETREMKKNRLTKMPDPNRSHVTN